MKAKSFTDALRVVVQTREHRGVYKAWFTWKQALKLRIIEKIHQQNKTKCTMCIFFCFVDEFFQCRITIEGRKEHHASKNHVTQLLRSCFRAWKQRNAEWRTKTLKNRKALNFRTTKLQRTAFNHWIRFWQKERKVSTLRDRFVMHSRVSVLQDAFSYWRSMLYLWQN